MSAPSLELHLPELIQFTRQLAADYQRGVLTGWPGFIERVHAFYTPPMMDKIEKIVPGWGRMASYADQMTLIHVTSVLTTLWMEPEYQNATPEQQAIMPWIVMFHDVAKEARRGHHDYIHGFRSAVITGKALAQVGFPATAAYATDLDAWVDLIHNAIVPLDHEFKQDNTKLPEIIAGIYRMYGADTPAAWITKVVLLHVSLPTDPSYPTVAPLTDAEVAQYFDAAFFPLMRLMMFVDTDSWNMFDTPLRMSQHQTATAYFGRVAAQLGIVQTSR